VTHNYFGPKIKNGHVYYDKRSASYWLVIFRRRFTAASTGSDAAAQRDRGTAPQWRYSCFSCGAFYDAGTAIRLRSSSSRQLQSLVFFSRGTRAGDVAPIAGRTRRHWRLFKSQRRRARRGIWVVGLWLINCGEIAQPKGLSSDSRCRCW